MKTVEPRNIVKLVCDGPTGYRVAKVDAGRLAELSAYAWRAMSKGSRSIVVRWDGGNVSLAADVYGPIPDGHTLAHRDGNDMNCQRSNLIVVAKGQHRRKVIGRMVRSCYGYIERKSTSRFRGVSLYRGKWRAFGRLKGKKVHLGEFGGTPAGEIAAARAHDKFLREHFGGHALFNFPR